MRDKRRKLTRKQIIEIQNLANSGHTAPEIAKRYSVTPITIYNILWRKTYQDVRPDWKHQPTTPPRSDKRKLTPEQVIEIQDALNNGVPLAKIKYEYGICHRSLQAIQNRETYRDVRPYWRYRRRTRGSLTTQQEKAILLQKLNGVSIEALAEKYLVTEACIERVLNSAANDTNQAKTTPPVATSASRTAAKETGIDDHIRRRFIELYVRGANRKQITQFLGIPANRILRDLQLRGVLNESDRL